MAEGEDNLPNLEEDGGFYHEGLAHVEELLISSREECIDIGSKYQNLSLQVENLLQLQESSSGDISGESETFEDAKECRNDIEEHMNKYETRIATYQENQEHQSRIVDDLQLRVEEYRMRCAKLEAALAEHSANEANITETDSQSQNDISMSLETALIRIEQEKNRCQGLTQINSLLREQLETATEVNQTLTSDIHRLTKEWQHARSELLAKETEWKEEEQTFSLYFTKESNTLVQMWRQVLNFRQDFASLRSHAERELSSFKVCICNTLRNLNDVQSAIANKPDMYAGGDTIDYTKGVRNQNELEIPRLQERISELINRNDRIQHLLDEKERANTMLCSTVEKINDSLNQSLLRTQAPAKDKHLESLCNQYSKAFEDLSHILQADGSMETSSLFTVLPFADFSAAEDNTSHASSNMIKLQSLVNAVKVVLQKYRKQAEESNLQISSLEDQSLMQKRTVEFLEDERQKMQQLNSQLSLQFDLVNQKMQSFLKDLQTDSSAGSKETTALETVVKSLRDQVESLQTERDNLVSMQAELRSNLQSSNEERRLLKHSEQTLTADLNRSTKRLAELEMRLESLRKEYQNSLENLNQLTLDKELLEQEKKKFTSHLSNLETQCLDFQNCLRRLRDEESLVKDSLSTLQSLSDGLCLEKSDLSKALDKALDELEDARSAQNSAKIEFEKEKLEWKLQVDKLEHKILELECERDKLQKELQSIEDSKQSTEDEKSLITIRNNDLTNQVTKYTTQKKTLQSELDQARSEITRLSSLITECNTNHNQLSLQVSELGLRAETAELEAQRLAEVSAALEAEKTRLETALYESQKEAGRRMSESREVEKLEESKSASVAGLQAQLNDLQAFHEQSVEDGARERDALLLKMQQLEQEFQTSLKNEQLQHQEDIQHIKQEKDDLRNRMVSSIDELFERHQKQQEDFLSQHQEEVSTLKQQISLHGKEYEDKVLEFKEENKKIHNLYKEQISSLEHDIENLKNQLSDSEDSIEELKEKMATAERVHQSSMHENTETLKKLKNEMNTMRIEHSNVTNNLENKIKDLKQEKESVQHEIQRLELQLTELDSERNKLEKELDDRNIHYETEKNLKSVLEERISQLHTQLTEEQSRKEVLDNSLEDCKNRLRVAQRDNTEIREQLEEARSKLEDKDTAVTRLQSQNTELKNTLKEVEKSRQESKREVHSLKRNISSLEKRLHTCKQEVDELNTFHSREEEIQDELKREIVQLKQKLMETSAKSEANSKELTISRKKVSDLEHKLQMQKEQEQSLLRECLSSEQSLSEQRLGLERQVAEASREAQMLRGCLRSEEGKVLALEGRVVKLDGAKREIETKLYSICLFLRSILGLGTTDSGFLSNSLRYRGNSPGPSRGNSSEKLADSPKNVSKSSGNVTTQLSLTELDVELLKTSLFDLVQRFSAAEKERDELKDAVSKVQNEAQNLKTEHSQCTSTIYQLKRELKDKHVLEKELATKISTLIQNEETIRTLEREKRWLSEKISNSDFYSSNALKEKEKYEEKVSELKRNESRLQGEISELTTAKEESESRTSQCVKAYHSLEDEFNRLKGALATKEQKLKDLEQKAESAIKKVKSSESRAKSLESTISHLQDMIEKQTQTESLLNVKVSQLSTSLSQSSTSHLSLSEEVEKKSKESLRHQTELYKAQHTNEELKSSNDNYKLKNETLRQEVTDLKKNLQQSEVSLQAHMEHIRKLQKDLLSSQNLEKDAADQLERLQEQKKQLDERLKSTSSSLRITKEQLGDKEEITQKLEKECADLKKILRAAEREKSRSSETSACSLMERSSLTKSLSQTEMENEALQKKVQNLQAQLTELEERHSQRVRDFLLSRSKDAKSEESRLRSALRQAEQLMEAREKNHRQKVMGLEEQITVLKEGLEREQTRWQQYHQRSLSASANINYLHTVLGQSLQTTATDPQRLLPEAERLDMTTEAELSVSQDISLTTPSKLRGRGSRQMTSTPKARRKL